MTTTSQESGNEQSTEGHLSFRPGPGDRQPAAYARRRRSFEVAIAFVAPISFFALWQIASTSGWLDERFFPAPTTVWSTAIELVRTGELQESLAISTRRALIGLAFGVVSGCAMGILLGLSPLWRAALEPFLSACYTVPKLALLPLLLLIFGIGEAPKIVLIAITVFFFVWIATMEAVMSMPESYREAGRSLGAGPWQAMRHIVIPAILPQIFVSIRLSAGVSILVIVGAEFVQGGDGIGYLIWHSWSLLRAEAMYVGIVAVALLGFVLGEVVKWVGRLLMPWAPRDAGRAVM